jgi:hypothetical protein
MSDLLKTSAFYVEPSPKIPVNACDLVYLVQNDIITVNEARRLIGLTPLEVE